MLSLLQLSPFVFYVVVPLEIPSDLWFYPVILFLVNFEVLLNKNN